MPNISALKRLAIGADKNIIGVDDYEYWSLKSSSIRTVNYGSLYNVPAFANPNEEAKFLRRRAFVHTNVLFEYTTVPDTYAKL